MLKTVAIVAASLAFSAVQAGELRSTLLRGGPPAACSGATPFECSNFGCAVSQEACYSVHPTNFMSVSSPSLLIDNTNKKTVTESVASAFDAKMPSTADSTLGSNDNNEMLQTNQALEEVIVNQVSSEQGIAESDENEIVKELSTSFPAEGTKVSQLFATPVS